MTSDKMVEFEQIPKPSKDHWTVCWIEVGDMPGSKARSHMNAVRNVVIDMMKDAYGVERPKILFAAMQHGEKTMEFESVGANEYVIWRLKQDG